MGLFSVRHALLALVLAFTGLQGVAHAGLFDDEEARKAILDLRQQVAAGRQALETAIKRFEDRQRESQRESQNEQLRSTTEESALLRRALLDLQNQIESVRSEMTRLTGLNEQTNRAVSDLQIREKDLARVQQGLELGQKDLALGQKNLALGQKDLALGQKNLALGQQDLARGQQDLTRAQQDLTRGQQDLARGADERVRQLEAVKVTVDGRDILVEPAERRAFDTALASFRSGDFGTAQSGFSSLMLRFPQTGYMPSALFWLGNAQYATRDYKEAITNFRILLKEMPEHLRAPEAMLSIANCQVELKDVRGARKSLEDLAKAYPQSEAAKASKERLARLR